MSDNDSEQTTDTAAVLFGIVVQLTFERDLARKERDEARKELDEERKSSADVLRWKVAQSDARLVRVLAELEVARKERDEARANMVDAFSSNPQYDRSADAAGLLGWEGRDLHSKTIGTIQKARVTYSDPGFGAVEIFFATTWHRVNDCTVRLIDG